MEVFNNIRVTHMLWGLQFGGIETMLVNILNEQVKRGLEVSCVVINDELLDELVTKIDERVCFVCLHRKVGTKNLQFIRNLNQMLDEIAPDVIHLHNSHLFNFINRQHRRMSYTVSTVHDMPIGKIGMSCSLVNLASDFATGMKGNVRCLNRINQVCAISNSVAQALKSQYGIDSKVVFNGIHTDSFMRNEHSNPHNTFNIVQVSRLDHEKKGQDLLIYAVSQLYNRGYKNITLSFIGDGKSRTYLEQLVKRLKLGGVVKFLGGCQPTYVEKHLCEYDLLAQPSRYEGFGLTVAEGMAAGLPVIVSSGQGPEEITEKEHFGWTFENGNIEALVRKIEYILNNKEEVNKKSHLAYIHVCQNYDIKVTVSRYLDVYKQVGNK